MTSETYLDLTFDRSGKSGKRAIRPKLLKLTDVTMPHRSRKKTKVKSKDRSVSSVRDRIYDDPAYTDDISHLANPLRRNSCSGKADGKAKSFASGNTVSNLTASASSSLGKRSKLSKEFLQQNKLRDGGAAYERDASSSSDEPLRSESQSKSGATASAGRRGRSLERSAAASSGAKSGERKREKRERSNKQKSNTCMESHTLTQQADMQQKQDSYAETTTNTRASSNRRSKTQSTMMTKQYSDGAAADLQWAVEQQQARDEISSMHSGPSAVKAVTATSAAGSVSSKMQIGRRFLRGEIGIKSFNYYLLKEGIKSSKRFVEKQRNSFTSGLASAASGGRKTHSRSEENIYEEIFFKDAPPSDDEQQQLQEQQQQQPPPPPLQQSNSAHTQLQPQTQQQQHTQHAHQGRGADTPISQCSGSEEGVYADCELCLQQCTKENCEYCYAQQASGGAVEHGQSASKIQRDMAKPYAVVPLQQQQTLNKLPQQFDTAARTLITQAPSAAPADYNSSSSNGGMAGAQLPAAHILEFQSYNPNNPGVYKIETTPVAITGEYNPILQFQQSSPSTGTATTTTPSIELQPLGLAQHASNMAHQQQQPQLIQQQVSYQPTIHHQQQQQQQQHLKHSSNSYLLQTGGVGGAPTHHHYHQSPTVATSSAGILITQQRARGHRMGSHQHQQQHSHYMLTYQAPTMAAGPPISGGGGMQRMNTKSSSSSDSLQQHQHLHKYNTMSRLEAQHVLLGDPFYGGTAIGPTHSLMFAASRPIGGSQILVDSYELPQMYKSDSRASILSEYSLRSSDNSHRYNRFRYAGGGGGSFSGVAGGGGQVSDSSLGDSLFSCTSAQRRYFGSSESCRFGFECRRCSLDGGEKCSFSDTCRYECRNCDCSSSYFSSDFDDMYGSVAGAGGSAAALGAQRSSGIPRKTAAGTLPASVGNAEYERKQEQLDLKQNKYAQDFFKHVNDVKRSIYQSEMQRNASGAAECAVSNKYESNRTKGGERSAASTMQAPEGSPRRYTAKEAPQITTLPLTKERSRAARATAGTHTDSSTTPTPAPRTSLQQSQPQPTQRASRHATATVAYERHSEYPSLDRLVASATGAIPKATTVCLQNAGGGKNKTNATDTLPMTTSDINSNNDQPICSERHSPRHSTKNLKITDRPLGLTGAYVHTTDADTAKASARSTRVAAEALTNNNNNNNITVANHNETPVAALLGASTAGSAVCGGSGGVGSMKREPRYLSVEHTTGSIPAVHTSKRHHRSSSASKQSSLSVTRRSKDIPAPPPPSPATYSDLQELKVNIENAQKPKQLDEVELKKSSAERRKKKHAKADIELQQQQQVNITNAESQSKREKEKDAQRQLSLKTTKDAQLVAVAQLSPTKNDKCDTVKATKLQIPVTATATKNADISLSQDLCERPAAALLAAAKSPVATAVAAAGANCMPDTATKQQQQQQQQLQQQLQERTHAKLNNANCNSKHASEAVKQLEMCNSAHATDDDDVFYDARSEDSGGTVSSSLLRRQKATAATAAAAAATVNSGSERRGKTTTSPEFNREQHKEEEEAAAAGEKPSHEHIASGSDIKLDTDYAGAVQSVAENDEANATTVQTKSKDTLAANSESVKTERTKSATSNNKTTTIISSGAAKSAAAQAEATNVTNVAAAGATGYSAMALNLGDEANAENAATSATTTLPSSEKHKDVGGSGALEGGSTSSGHQTRREKKRRAANSSSSRESSGRQHKAATIPAMTISCDTCCQIECEQYQQQQQQQTLLYSQSSRRHESRAETKTKTSKAERANKIKDEKCRERAEATTKASDTTSTLARNEQATIAPTTIALSTSTSVPAGKERADSPSSSSPTCATAMLTRARAAAATAADTQPTVVETLQLHAMTTTTVNTTITTTTTDGSPEEAVTTTIIVEQIGAQSDNSERNIETCTQHVAKHVANSAHANEQTVNKCAQHQTPADEELSEVSSTTTTTATTTNATIIITPAEATATTTIPETIAALVETVDSGDATMAAKLLTASTAAPATLTTAPTLAVTSTAPACEAITATTSPCTSAANSTVSCISDIAGVTTPSYSAANLPTITTTAHSSLDSDQPSTQLKATRDQGKRPPLYRQDYSTCVDSSEAQSDDSHLTRDSVTRESQNDELSSSTHDKLDVSTLPLPALPPKKRRTRLRASPSRHHSGNSSRRGYEHDTAAVCGNDEQRHSNITTGALNLKVANASAGVGSGSGGSCGEATPHLSAFQQYVAKRRESLEASTRSFNEKLEARRMHYHMGGGGGCENALGSATVGGTTASGGAHMPTYLFGEHYYGVPAKVTGARKSTHGNKEEIFLNKSGWVQVNTKRNSDENRGVAGGGYRNASYAHQNGGSVDGERERERDLRRTVRVIQIDNTRRSDRARQALQQQQQYSLDPAFSMGKYPASKVEELIQRNQARVGSAGGPVFVTTRDNALRPGYRIVDPQLASILNERPGFLPVRNLHDADSPPPITPILSPPPAFQDSSKSKYIDRRKTIPIRQHQSALTANNLLVSNVGNGSAGKGMVFSRSFEYDARRNVPADTYVETFSRSFDGNLSERPPLQRERSPNFSTLTGNSPNYLTKKDSGGGSSGSLRSRDNSPKYQHSQTTAYLNASIKEAPPAYSLASANSNAGASSRFSPRSRHERSFERSKSHNVLVRSRKSQFSRGSSGGAIVGSQQPMVSVGMSRFRSFDTTASQRLNSCDSGARSDLSNDELDCDDDEGSNEFLTANYHHSISPLKTQRQRSLTPERNESHSSSSSIRKQRSLTPESRSLTPEDRRRKGGSQVSLMGSRQNSSSRSNTLERKQRLTEGQPTTNISRSSSSSSYSGGGGGVVSAEQLDSGVVNVGAAVGSITGMPNTALVGGTVVNTGMVAMTGSGGRSQHRRSLGRNAKQVDEHRIRRSRSLQLSERSPNRSHKVIVSMGQSQGPAVTYHSPNAQPIYQQAGVRISNGNAMPARPPIRTSSKSQSLLLSSNNTNTGRTRNNDIDKSRSFDFDYCNYSTQVALKGHSHAVSSGSNNQNVPLRLDFDKSRSFDDDYREPLNTISNNLATTNGSGMRYLQAIADPGMGGNTGSNNNNRSGRLRRSSPVGTGSGERNSRSPQSSGSSCNNLHLPRQSTSPQNYGTRLCDHELTYDMLRKSLDRSPIMDFRRGDSGEYDLSPALLRNRETINSGGNSELNFFNNDHIYEQPTTSKVSASATGSSLKQQRSLGHTHSPSESQYSLERQHSNTMGRESQLTPESASGGGDYRGEHIYRQPHTRESSRESAARSGGSSRNSQKFTTAKTFTTNKSTSKPITTTTVKCNKNPLKRQEALLMSQTTCSFWPHCGACNPIATPHTQHDAAYAKRQMSLQEQQQLTLNCQRATDIPLRRYHSAHASNGTDAEKVSQVRRSGRETQQSPYLPHFKRHNSNISTVSVNSNFNVAGEEQKKNGKLAGVTRSKTQWTLLCSGATLMDCIEESHAKPTRNTTDYNSTTKRGLTTKSATIDAGSNKNDTLKSRAVASFAIKSASLPLAGTSSIFLGECEMPITRERETSKRHNRESEVREREREIVCEWEWQRASDNARQPIRRATASAEDYRTLRDIRNNEYMDYNTLQYEKQTENVGFNGNMVANGCKTNKSRPAAAVKVMSTTTTKTATSTSVFAKHAKPFPTRTTSTTATCGMPHLRERYFRSSSLPNIWLPSHGSPRAKNSIALPTVNDVKSSYTTNLTHQMRAVSSPSLTDALQEELNYASVGPAAATAVFNTHTQDSGTSGESTPTMVTAANNNQSNSSTSSSCNNNSGRPLGSLPSSQSVGVLQKFKRTLTNFNKPTQQQQQQQQQQPQHITSSNSTQALAMTNSMSTTSATIAGGGSAGGINAIAGEHQSDQSTANVALEGTAGKYRFGPLIWRSSKERRKTKYNRRDKCNSGDSGIQIELDNDEQFSRIMLPANCIGGGGGVGNVSATTSNATVSATSTQCIAKGKVTQKMRTVRRANSAKATSITNQSATAAVNAKAKILKRMEIHGGSIEREAPESLPARSLSQPNGLDTCGIGGRTTGDMEDSDSDSITSHEEAPNYYPIYAEVLYSFTAAGPQELGLERGTLIEVLRKEVGPWWFGRIRKDDNNTLVEEILDPELGWFPKEFVRVIQCPKTDVFFLSQMSTNGPTAAQQQAPTTKSSSFRKLTKANTTTTPPAESTTTTPQSSIVTMTADSTAESTVACDLDATIVDENNVTTIVIESPSYASLANAPSNTHSPPDGGGGSGVVAADSSNPSNALAPSRSINVILDSADMLRRSAVKELLDTEVNYVKLLAAICEGYLPAMSKRIDIFSPNSIRLIFSNITAIYKFQRKFLEALRKGIEQNQVAKVFLKMHKGFLCYSTYCNAYPRALIELETYDRIKDARTILDNCRETENLAELPLSAHLLAPVQRICRYPLHLSEILKGAAKCGEMPEHELGEYEQIDVSQLDIPDTYEKIDLALEAMRGITEAVNEGKRHSETIARHQASFQNFKGPPLHLHSTRFFLQIDATRQKQNLWNSSCTLFLFDNQLIYCKRDIIKRSHFIYKGRIFLDRCRVVNVRDGKMFGHNIRNSLRIYCEARDKWFDFSFRSANRKHRFLSTLALERQFGGKAFYVSEMTGFEYAYDERDYSDQSDYELPECENSNSSGGGGNSTAVAGAGAGLSGATRHWSMADVSTANAGGASATSGDSSVPESPVKHKYCDTLPKKSQTRDACGGSGTVSECQTGSLGRRRLGNWFRKPKSSNSTPNHSPTHKANELSASLVGGSENNISINLGSGNYISSGSSA
ncbi:serine-rich adhesin for platelets isoform X2 [Bactrocera oleae]|uniref:serine-rich adhesin for platelets isoform X2 n=1 Tax=Bactrocera oleae TaxID=104688 RepID=UPI00387EBDE0